MKATIPYYCIDCLIVWFLLTHGDRNDSNMRRTLRVISINFPFKTPWVVQEPRLTTARAFFDFDVVVLRPYPLLGNRPGGVSNIESHEYSEASREVLGKSEDIVRLLQQGGLLVVILDVLQVMKFNSGAHSYTGGTIYTVTNYDFLSKHFFHCVRNGTGSNVEIFDHAEPFSVVIKTASVQWTAFIAEKPADPFSFTRFFARNGAGSFVGGQIGLGAGNVIFLPNFRQLNEEQFFEACYEYRFKREATPVPPWAKEVSLPGASDADSKIAQIGERMREIEQLLLAAIRERDGLLALKKLLYEKGKTQLEPIVRRALDRLGFATTPSGTIPGTGFEIDGRTTKGSQPGILEVKGSKKQISLDEFSPFVPKILADFQASHCASKGVLVGNGLCEEPPTKRIGDKVFSSHVLQAARSHSIALVSSVELYAVICGVLSGDITELERIREAILTTNGYVNLMQFWRKSPFPEEGT